MNGLDTQRLLRPVATRGNPRLSLIRKRSQVRVLDRPPHQNAERTGNFGALSRETDALVRWRGNGFWKHLAGRGLQRGPELRNPRTVPRTIGQLGLRFAALNQLTPAEATHGPDSFRTVAEVAALLRVNQQTVRNRVDHGELRAVTVGKRRVRIRQSDLDAFLAASTAARYGGARLTMTRRPFRTSPTLLTRSGTVPASSSRTHSAVVDSAMMLNPSELADALRRLAGAAQSLADNLDREHLAQLSRD
jgi:excisionase family DNA binding protein